MIDERETLKKKKTQGQKRTREHRSYSKKMRAK